MPHGVHVFDVIEDKHIDSNWVRDEVLGTNVDRYRHLREGHYLFTREEADKIVHAFKMAYNIEPHELFDWDADILPAGRRRRRKGTVTKNNVATGAVA